MGILFKGKLEGEKFSGPVEMGEIISKLKKSKGEKIVVHAPSVPDVLRIPTGIFELDYATGGGFPRGRLSIVYGPESSCKTNICYKAAANAQKLPPPCNVVVWVDLEGTFDPKWAKKFGIDLEALVLVKPGFGEEAVDAIEALVYAKECVLLVVDSIAALVPAKEIEGAAEDQQPGRGALLAKKLTNKIAVALGMESRREHYPSVIYINQTRFKIGVMHGDPETQPGGKTMLFISSLTLRTYGKNRIVKELDPEKPAFKDLHVVIKKAKVGVRQSAFDFSMALMEIGELCIGDSESWNTVSNHLKQLGVLKKGDKSGWVLFGKNYSTLIPIADMYDKDHSFKMLCQSKVVGDSGVADIVIEGVTASTADYSEENIEPLSK